MDCFEFLRNIDLLGTLLDADHALETTGSALLGRQKPIIEKRVHFRALEKEAVVVEIEILRDIDAVGAGHTISASCAVDLQHFSVLLPYRIDQSVFVGCQRV